MVQNIHYQFAYTNYFQHQGYHPPQGSDRLIKLHSEKKTSMSSMEFPLTFL